MQRHDDALVVVALATTLDMFVLLLLRLLLLSLLLCVLSVLNPSRYANSTTLLLLLFI